MVLKITSANFALDSQVIHHKSAKIHCIADLYFPTTNVGSFHDKLKS